MSGKTSVLDYPSAAEMALQIEQSKAIQEGQKCHRSAPRIFFQDTSGRGYLVQGCCNDWQCPRCGHIRARQEHTRMVYGARWLSEEMKKPLYFWTLTSPGWEKKNPSREERKQSLENAEANYLAWTDQLLTAGRNKANRADEYWCYAGVTERQKRQHPHSHIIMTYCPPDAWPYKRGEKLPLGNIARHDGLWSDWLVDAARRAGLGEMCDLSAVRSPEAVASYCAEYMFEDATRTKWPKGWRRVRYSNNWPKLPEPENETAFPVIRMADWLRMDALGIGVRCDTWETYNAALARQIMCVLPPNEKEPEVLP